MSGNPRKGRRAVCAFCEQPIRNGECGCESVAKRLADAESRVASLQAALAKAVEALETLNCKACGLWLSSDRFPGCDACVPIRKAIKDARPLLPPAGSDKRPI